MADSDWGGLLGGPRDDLIAPLVGEQGMAGARRNALLNFGAGLLSQSGYSRMPVSTGQALAAGIQGAQGAYAGSLDQSMKGALQMQQLKSAQFDLARRQMLQRAAASLLGGGAPQQGQDAPQGAAGGASPGQAGPGPGMGAMGSGGAPGMGAPGMPPHSLGESMPQPAAAAAAAGNFSRQAADAMTLLDPEHQAGYQAMYERNNPALQMGPDGRLYNARDPAAAQQNYAALPQGMVRDAQGNVSLAPGFAASQSQLDMQKAYAEHSQDLVPQVIPGQGTVMVPRSALGIGVGVGPDGKPRLALGGSGLSQEDPALLKEREGDVATFLAAKSDALTKAQAAGESLQQLDNLDGLIHQAAPQMGRSAQYEVGRALAAAGMLSKDGAANIDAIKQFQQQQQNATLSGLRSTFGARISNMDLMAAQKTLGNVDDPMNAVLMANDIKRVTAQRQQAYADFLQGYDGPRGAYEKAWRESPDGQKSLYDYPEMWKHLPVQRGKAGTPVEGQTFVKTPKGSIYPVQLNQYGEPAPIEGQ